MEKSHNSQPLQGIDVLIKYSLMSDVRWDVANYQYRDIINELSQSDKDLLTALDYIGDGELSGATMFIQLITFVEKAKDKKGDVGNLRDFTEIILYGLTAITYDEFRHGVVLKELRAQRDNENFIDTVDSKKTHTYLAGKEIWKNPYEILVSLFLGEIINETLYKAVGDSIDNKDFKKIIKNIEKDERRHKMAWFELTHKLIQKPKHRKKYIKALKNVHALHQAETGYTFTEGMTDTRTLLTPDLMNKIHEARFKMLNKLLGDDMPLIKEEMIKEHHRHTAELIKEKISKEKKK